MLINLSEGKYDDETTKNSNVINATLAPTIDVGKLNT